MQVDSLLRRPRGASGKPFALLLLLALGAGPQAGSIEAAKAPPTAGIVSAAPGSDPGREAALYPDTVFRPEGGPQVAFFSAGSTEVVSLRVSVPLEESFDEAGAAQILRVQARNRMVSLGERIGARVDVTRTPHALVYQVYGSVQDLDFLGWILAEGLSSPQPSLFDEARRSVSRELDRRLETPEGTLSLRLRAQLVPGTAPLEGRAGTLERLDHGHVSALWARTHLRSRLQIVVAGRVDPLLALATVAELGIPDEGPRPQLPAPEATGDPRGSPEVIRHWLARGYTVAAEHTPRALVAARHLSLLVRESPGDYEVFLELWDLGRSRALVVTGAAYDRSRTAMIRRLDGLLDESEGLLGPERVRAISAELRTELRMATHSPWGLANLVGQRWEAGEGVEGAARLLDALEGVEEADVRRLLASLREGARAQEELRP